MRLLFGQSPFYCFLAVALSVGPGSVPVVAHNVVSGAYADGMMIEGEVGFSNGEMAQPGSPVMVYDAQGELLAELMLTEGGVFLYEAKARAKHVFKADLSAGHVAEMVIEADELTLSSIASANASPLSSEASNKLVANTRVESSPEAQASANNVGTVGKANPNPVSDDLNLSSNISVAQLESIVRSAVAQQIRPLQKELRAYKEKVMLRDITGGLGFIFGLFGVAAWMASKRKQGEKNATVS